MKPSELVDVWETKLKPNERHNNHAEMMFWIDQYRQFGDKAVAMIRILDAENEKHLKAEKMIWDVIKEQIDEIKLLKNTLFGNQIEERL